MRRFAALLTASILLLCSCSSSESNKSAREVIDSAFAASDSFPEHEALYSHDENGEERDGWRDEFEILFDFEGEKAKEFAIYYSTALTADEIAVVKLENASDAEDFEQAADKHIKERLKDFRSYGPEEVAKLEGAVVTSVGSFYAVIVADSAAEIESAFKNSFKSE